MTGKAALEPLVAEGCADPLQAGVPGGTEWWQSLLVILAEVIGIGVLSLPQALAELGWIPGLLAMTLGAYASWWSGQMYAQLVVAVPSAKVLADVSDAACGRCGRSATMWLGYTYIAGVGVVYHLTATEALQQMFVGIRHLECQPASGMLFALLMLVPVQARSMHAVSFISIIGSATILLALVIVGIRLVMAGAAANAQTALVEDVSLFDASAAVTRFVYAFAGQAIFVEIISKQRVFSSFKLAVSVSVVIAFLTYLLCSALGYVYLGHSIHGAITSALPIDIWTRIVNFCLFVHVSIGYIVMMNVLTDAMLRLVWPTAWPLAEQKTVATSGVELARPFPWLVMSTMLIFSAYLLESSVPFFSDLVSLSGAIGGSQILLSLPAMCALKLLPPLGFSKFERLQCYVAIPIAMLLTVFGASGAIIHISNALADDSRQGPWTCAAPTFE